MKFLYKYPQAEFPYARLVEREPQARRPGLRVRAARHRHLRRGPLLRHLHRVRQGRPGRPVHPHRGVQPRARPGAAAHAAAPVVSQHLGLGAGRLGTRQRLRTVHPARPRRPPASSASSPTTSALALTNIPASYRLGPPLPLRPRRRRRPVHLQRDQRPARLRPRRQVPPPVRQGRLPPPRRQRRGLPQPRARRHQGRPALRLRRRAAGRLRRAPPAAVRRTATTTRSATSTPSSPAARPRPTPFTTPSIRRTRNEDERRVQRQAFAGLLWTKQSYLFDVQRLAGRRQPGRPAAGVAAAHPQRPLAASQLHAP